MMSLFSRVLNFIGAGDEGSASPVNIGTAGTAAERPAPPRIQELELTIVQQREQIDRAVSLLQNAAYLAGYHQRPLERDIRSFLADLNSTRGAGIPGIDRAQPEWLSTNSERLTA